MKKLLRTSAMLSLIFATTFWLAERMFYGGVDENGVLQESFFLPLSVLLAAMGLICLVLSLVVKPKP